MSYLRKALSEAMEQLQNEVFYLAEMCDKKDKVIDKLKKQLEAYETRDLKVVMTSSFRTGEEHVDHIMKLEELDGQNQISESDPDEE